MTGFTLLGGDFFARENAFAEQMTVWRDPDAKKSKKTGQVTFVPSRHDPAKQFWREFPAVFCEEGESVRRPGVVRWVEMLQNDPDCPLERKRLIRFAISGMKYGDKDFFVQNVFWDSLMVNKQLLIDIGANWREKIKVEINRCEQLADAIRKLAGNLYLASGGTKGDAKSWDKTFLKSRESASAQLYFRLDMPFRRWLAGITPEEVDSADYETEERVFSAWQKTAKTIAYSCAEELAMHAGDAAMVGHEIKNEKSGDSVRYSAPKAIHQFRIQVAEIYKKI